MYCVHTSLTMTWLRVTLSLCALFSVRSYKTYESLLRRRNVWSTSIEDVLWLQQQEYSADSVCVQLCDTVPKEVVEAEMTGALVKFLKDTEPEVRTAAAFKVTGQSIVWAWPSIGARQLANLSGCNVALQHLHPTKLVRV